MTHIGCQSVNYSYACPTWRGTVPKYTVSHIFDLPRWCHLWSATKRLTGHTLELCLGSIWGFLFRWTRSLDLSACRSASYWNSFSKALELIYLTISQLFLIRWCLDWDWEKYAVGKQPSILINNGGRKWTLRWWFWWWRKISDIRISRFQRFIFIFWQQEAMQKMMELQKTEDLLRFQLTLLLLKPNNYNK